MPKSQAPLEDDIYEKYLEDAIDDRVEEIMNALPEVYAQRYYDYIDPEGHIAAIADDEETKHLTLNYGFD